ncbi:hypothetical protein ACO0RG_003224 [Hanseniaspora osmophila]
MQSNQHSEQQGHNLGQKRTEQQKNQGLNTEQFESGFTSQNPSGYSATRTTKTTTYGDEPMEGNQQWGSSGDDNTGFGSNTGRTSGTSGGATRSSKMGGGGYDELEEAGDDDEFGKYSSGREHKLQGSSQYQEGTLGMHPDSAHADRHQRGAFQGNTASNDADQYGRSYNDDDDHTSGNRDKTEKKKNIVQKGADKAKDMLERL